jgi:hypothetical protein
VSDTKAGVEPRFLPSQDQRDVWNKYVMWSDGTADGWWLGWCPRHDDSQDAEKATAEFNFMTGRFRCTGAISCHEGKPHVTLSTAEAWRQGFGSLKEMRAKQREANGQRRAAQRDERKASRNEKYAIAAKKLDALASKFKGLDKALLPTKPQYIIWEDWVDFSQAPATVNHAEGWWVGRCPLHDKADSKAHSARFNFRYGSYKCLAPEPCHAPKKGMTLVNLARSMEQKRG